MLKMTKYNNDITGKSEKNESKLCVCVKEMKTYSKRMKSFSKINTFYFILNWNIKKKREENVTGNQNIA